VTTTFEYLATNGIRLHTALAGPPDGDPVFLLHGFPDAWFGWQAQIGPLAEAGFRVIAPDQRGYNLSDKPPGVASYRMSALVGDILGLAAALGYQRFHLAGHDFGAMVGWNLAMRHPQRLARLAIANVPHPAVMAAFLRTRPSQMLRSWYAAFFQLPALPERAVRAGDWRLLMSAMPRDLTPAERDRYRQAWAQPGAITAMINWYRASLRHLGRSTASPRIRVPVLVLWGQRDPHLSYEMAPPSVDLCQDGRLVTFEEAGHWVLRDEPAAVSRRLIRHFSGGPDRGPRTQARTALRAPAHSTPPARRPSSSTPRGP
jgi:pimeloyl-ACP methyl ester carboxylesterase